MKSKKVEKRKYFLGKVDNFKSREERIFERKHLVAYLKGKDFFSYGKHVVTKKPLYHKVEYEWI